MAAEADAREWADYVLRWRIIYDDLLSWTEFMTWYTSHDTEIDALETTEEANQHQLDLCKTFILGNLD